MIKKIHTAALAKNMQAIEENIQLMDEQFLYMKIEFI